jgi:hypothetical protein
VTKRKKRKHLEIAGIARQGEGEEMKKKDREEEMKEKKRKEEGKVLEHHHLKIPLL